MTPLNLAIVALFAFLYSALSERLERTSVSGALLFMLFGWAAGPEGLGWLEMDGVGGGLRFVAELTLALILFTDAAAADRKVLAKNIRIPERLLLVGLPLTILAGWMVGSVLFPALAWIEVAILAVMLAPTDAALGRPVVSNEAVPARIRESLNVESGLNDGISVPLLLLFLALAAEVQVAGGTPALAMKLVGQGIGIGVAVGLGLTFLGSRLLHSAVARGWVSPEWARVPVVSLAVANFAVAEVLGGSGFIATFVGGLLFRRLPNEHKRDLLATAESTGSVLALVTWVIFGGGVVGQGMAYLDWKVVLYAVLSLTAVRMLPVFLALTGTGLRTGEKLFMGWFGPRGLASIVFGVIVLGQNLPGGDTLTITVIATVTLSVVAHGVSANPLVAALVRGEEEHGKA